MAGCPTVDLELVQTTRNVNGTRHSVRKFQPGNGTTFLDFPVFLGIFQWDEPTKRVPFTAEREIPEILTKWKAPRVSPRLSPLPSRPRWSRLLLTDSKRELLQKHNADSCVPRVSKYVSNHCCSIDPTAVLINRRHFINRNPG